jgi:hypothetical protein
MTKVSATSVTNEFIAWRLRKPVSGQTSAQSNPGLGR